MKKFLGIVTAFFSVAVIFFMASCAGFKQIWNLNGILVSSNGQIYRGSYVEVPLDFAAGENSFTFNATSDPVDNGYPVQVAVSDLGMVSVTQSVYDTSLFTVNMKKSGWAHVQASCGAYKFTFIVYATDAGKGLTLEKLRKQHDDAVNDYSTTVYAPGNILYSDGTMTKPGHFKSSKTAVAIVFDAEKKLVVAIDGAKDLVWTPKTSSSYKKVFTLSDTDGSGNWNIVKSADPNGSANASVNYPAFNYASTYSAGNYSSGWYLPSADELKSIYRNSSKINESLAAMEKPLLDTSATYWSSSVKVLEGYEEFALGVFFANSGIASGCYKGDKHLVLPVRSLAPAKPAQTSAGSGTGPSISTGTTASAAGTKSIAECTVGDIVYSDGTASSAANYNSAKTAVAVIFDAENKLGVGLKQSPSTLTWSTKENGPAFRTPFATSKISGADNWTVIQKEDPDGSKNASVNYPAFNFANTYTASGFAKGWYLPAVQELNTLRANVSTVNASIAKISGAASIKTSSSYWSSSSNSRWTNINALAKNFKSGNTEDIQKDKANYVLVVRSFASPSGSASSSEIPDGYYYDASTSKVTEYWELRGNTLTHYSAYHIDYNEYESGVAPTYYPNEDGWRPTEASFWTKSGTKLVEYVFDGEEKSEEAPVVFYTYNKSAKTLTYTMHNEWEGDMTGDPIKYQSSVPAFPRGLEPYTEEYMGY